MTDLPPIRNVVETTTPGLGHEPLSAEDETFERLLDWLRLERERYQQAKWDYAEQDLENARHGLDEDSHFWVNGVLNYTSRLRLFPLGSLPWTQAMLKLVATLLAVPEHLVRGGDITEMPEPGHPSGEVRTWES
jgi:hypothetical protein